MKNNDFFFCYNKSLFTFIKDVKGIDYITIAKNPTTNKTFSMFYKSPELQICLDEYKKTQQQ